MDKVIQLRSLNNVTVWTIGYGNRTVKGFMSLLKDNKIQVLVDVRSFPTSKVEPFRKQRMEKWLPEHELEYIWLGKELGGYRKGGYPAHIKTKLFGKGIEKIMEMARRRRVCIMCLERNPKYCHRRYISAYLERHDVEVVHILKKGQVSLTKSVRLLE